MVLEREAVIVCSRTSYVAPLWYIGGVAIVTCGALCLPPGAPPSLLRVASAQTHFGYPAETGKGLPPVDASTKPEIYPIRRLRQASGRLLPVFVDGQLGFIDRRGKVVVEPTFQRLGIYGDSWRLELGMGDVPSELPRAVTAIPFADWFDGFSEGVCIVGRDGKCGFLRDDGKLIAPCRYTMVTRFQEGIAFGEIKGPPQRIEMLNREGQVLRSDIDAVAPVREGRVGVRIQGRWGFVNCAGKIVIAPQYDSVGSDNRQVRAARDAYFMNGAVQVWQNGTTGMIDRNGETIVPIKYANVTRREFGFEAVRGDGQKEYFDWGGGRIPKAIMPAGARSGHVTLRIDAADVVKIGTPQEGLVSFRIASGKWGYATLEGHVVIQPRFRFAGPFHAGCAVVSPDGVRWGLIGPSGAYCAEPRYEKVLRLSREQGADEDFASLFKVSQNGVWGIIDRRGNEIVASRFRRIELHSPLEFAVSNRTIRLGDRGQVAPRRKEFYGVLPDGTVAILGSSGGYLVEPRYIGVDWLIGGYRRFITKDGKRGFLDAKGRIAIRPQFDYAGPFFDGVALVGMGVHWDFDGTNEDAKWGYIRSDGSFLWKPSN